MNEAMIEAQEVFDILDAEGNILGRATRAEAHRRGLHHRVVHLWIADRRGPEAVLFLQQRSLEKRHYPGLYDMAVGGHVSAGEAPEEALLREIREEIGLVPEPERIMPLGVWDPGPETVGESLDWEQARVYLLLEEAPSFAPGPEVQRIVRVKARDYLAGREQHRPIPALGPDGEAFSLPWDAFCPNEVEFRALVLPELERRNNEE